ncbi:hypothetical protein QR680_017507 [Steinernema hermaphroditum]|uniref:carbonic anhydrase n=1 Tax=Steinernema hermaphroditum TaxID=289476 RepID=A0AA39LP97_9BILA|nr:hypothetical protein QR680_017507 [Steinernema hermaphroditum]
MTAHWNYEDSDLENGPTNWPGESHGSFQSPVDICHDAVEKIQNHDPLKFVNYNRPIHGDLVNNGHTSEHKPAELHLVHAGVEDPDRLVVLGVFLEVAENHKPLQIEFDTLVHVTAPNTRRQIANIVLEDKLPKDKSCVRYQGSLTTPPCSEVVTWMVFTQPVSITEEQLSALRQVQDSESGVLQKNRRPVQPLNGRQLFHVC